MLRLIKIVILLAIAAALVVLGVANMAPVDLQLLPQGLGDARYSLPGVPLSLVILAAFVLGVVVGELWEYVREGKHRRKVGQSEREISRLRQEVQGLKRRLGDDEDLLKIASS
ncbi:MAG: LapA family protein [Pseudomonadota bacterium]